MKKFTVLTLALLLCLSAFVACGDKNDPPDGTSGSTDAGGDGSVTTAADDLTGFTVNSTDYTIVSPDKGSAGVIDAGALLYERIEAATGVASKIKTDWVRDLSEIDPDACEILVGRTNRTESDTVFSELVGACFAIRKIGNKIVIVGSSDALTVSAVNCFIATYVTVSAGDGSFRIPEDLNHTSEQFEQVKLAESGNCHYRVVVNSKYLKLSPGDRNGKYDYVVGRVTEVREKIAELADCTVYYATDVGNLELVTDNDNYEILIGGSTRTEAREFLNSIDYNQYGYTVSGNKIIVAGWTDMTTGLAIDMFLNLLDASAYTDSDGKPVVGFDYSGPVVSTYSAYVTDIPEYGFGTVYYCNDLSDNGLEIYITGTSGAAYREYLTKLESAGFTLYCQSVANGNISATYTSDRAMVYAYFTTFDDTVRLVTAPMRGTNLPDLSGGDYQKITESSITQMTLNYAEGNFGNCYVITLEDGSFLIYDGGGDNAADVDRLYNLLVSLNKRTDGKIVIAGWVLTHEHSDHYKNFNAFCHKYGSKVTLEQFICNTPAKTYIQGSDGEVYYASGYAAASYAAGGPKVVKLHTGQRHCVRNAVIEVLLTVEDIFPQYPRIFNDVSVVTRLTLGDTTMMMLGDAESQASNLLMNNYGSYLKSDIVQISHHGYGMAPITLYGYIDADVAFWPTDDKTYALLTKPNGTGYYAIGYKLITSGGFTDIFLATTTKTIVLPYTPGSGAKES